MILKSWREAKMTAMLRLCPLKLYEMKERMDASTGKNVNKPTSQATAKLYKKVKYLSETNLTSEKLTPRPTRAE